MTPKQGLACLTAFVAASWVARATASTVSSETFQTVNHSRRAHRTVLTSPTSQPIRNSMTSTTPSFRDLPIRKHARTPLPLASPSSAARFSRHHPSPNLSGTRLACANDQSRPVTSAQPPDAPHDPGPAPLPTSPPESPRARFVRHGRRARLYTWAVLFVALLAVLIVLISRNTASVKLSWAFGSTHASIVWVILAAAVVGWLLGITTAVVFSRRTRRPR